jgi:hypothetical protein
MTDKNERFRPDSSNKPIIDHVADGVVDRDLSPGQPVVHDSTTSAGKPVEEQIRKKWDPKRKGGLPTFLGIG